MRLSLSISDAGSLMIALSVAYKTSSTTCIRFLALCVSMSIASIIVSLPVLR